MSFFTRLQQVKVRLLPQNQVIMEDFRLLPPNRFISFALVQF
jgi:hypothetical protein